MNKDLTLAGAALVSISIIAAGTLIGAMIFSIDVPFAPHIMVILAILIVFGASILIHSCRTAGDPSNR